MEGEVESHRRAFANYRESEICNVTLTIMAQYAASVRPSQKVEKNGFITIVYTFRVQGGESLNGYDAQGS